VANKLCALSGRAEVRDYIDVHAVLADGRFTGDELLGWPPTMTPALTPGMFAEALRAVRRFPSSAFEVYKLTPDQVDALTARLLGWADEIESAAR
jgi:hypothetical protein